MKKSFKVLGIILGVIILVILIDLAFVLFGKTNPIIAIHKKDSNVYYATLYKVYDCEGEKSITSYWDNFACPVKKESAEDLKLKKENAKKELMEIANFTKIVKEEFGKLSVMKMDQLATFEIKSVKIYKEIDDKLLINFDTNYSCKTGNDCIYFSQKESEVMTSFVGYGIFKYDESKAKYVAVKDQVATAATLFVGY